MLRQESRVNCRKETARCRRCSFRFKAVVAEGFEKWGSKLAKARPEGPSSEASRADSEARKAERGKGSWGGEVAPPVGSGAKPRRTRDFAHFFIDFEASSGVILSHFCS